LDEECHLYEDKIASAGGIELMLGGMGNNGHLAFNEPGSSPVSRTRPVLLGRDTCQANARFFDGDIDRVPVKALTVGLGTIMDAREVVIVVSGCKKASALAAAIENGVNHMCPVSCLQMHPRSIIVCDEDAAGQLKYATVKYFRDMEGVDF